MGDGSANESSVNYFKNFNKSLLNEFANDVRKVFGNVELSFNKDNIVFPISIRHIFSKFYSIGFGTFNATIPKRLFNLPKEYAKKFIQGFFDDEGNVQTSCVRFYSFNKELIKGIRNLMICKFPEIKPKGIKNRNKISNMEYCFSINAEDLEKFYKLIGCLHPDKKEKLKLYFKRKNRGWNHRKSGDTKTRILKSLKKDSKTIFEEKQ